MEAIYSGAEASSVLGSEDAEPIDDGLTTLVENAERAERTQTKAKAAEGRRAFVKRILKGAPACQAGHVIAAHLMNLPPRGLWRRKSTDPVWSRCDRDSVDVHELLARSAGGSIVEDANVIAVCRTCHDWIGNHPQEALAIGLRRSRYAGRNPTFPQEPTP